MSPEIAVRVVDLGKKYVIRHKASNAGLRHLFHDSLLRFWRTASGGERPQRAASLPPKSDASQEEFWALREISFDVEQGEVVGIVGRNGAGKSTLLKILSRITEPTLGRIEIEGRVASLLEVGTGFHPELTGRENIFLNGAILGMRRSEILRRFDEIVEFSGVSRFLDTPVKRYSSGMYVRLAFAVAAHLESEVMVIDEVLAVGDAEFQKKCLGRMRTLASSSGRTVFFVSHNLDAVSALCQRVLLMDQGRILAFGDTAEILQIYRSHAAVPVTADLAPERRPGRGTLRIVRVRAGNDRFSPFESKRFHLSIVALSSDEAPFSIGFHLFDDNDREVVVLDSAAFPRLRLEPVSQEICFELAQPWLKPGDYRVDVYLYGAGIIDGYRDAVRFSVTNEAVHPSGLTFYRPNGALVPAEFSVTVGEAPRGGG